MCVSSPLMFKLRDRVCLFKSNNMHSVLQSQLWGSGDCFLFRFYSGLKIFEDSDSGSVYIH